MLCVAVAGHVVAVAAADVAGLVAAADGRSTAEVGGGAVVGELEGWRRSHLPTGTAPLTAKWKKAYYYLHFLKMYELILKLSAQLTLFVLVFFGGKSKSFNVQWKSMIL